MGKNQRIRMRQGLPKSGPHSRKEVYREIANHQNILNTNK